MTIGVAHVWDILRDFASRRVVRNFGWYMAGEIAVRLSRLATTIVLARVLLPRDYGVAAIVLTTFELVRVLANCGLSAMIVRSSDESFKATCIAVNRLSYVVAFALMGLQVAVGYLIAQVSGRADLFAMLAWLSLAHIAVPLTDVCYGRLQRRDQLKTLAGIMSAQVLLDNALAASLALLGYGAWAVVLPKLLTTPLYVAMIWRADPAPLPRGVPALPMAAFLPFSLPLLGSEVLAALRLHLDKVLVGAFLGVETLGVYSFAFNAGLGISIALTAALTATLYPHLSEASRNGGCVTARYDAAVRMMVLPVGLLIAVQAVASMVYVPIIFGEKWAFAAPLVGLICLSGLLRPLYDATCQLLRAEGETRGELIGATTFTIMLMTAFASALNFGLRPALVVLAVVSIVGHGAFAYWGRIGRHSSAGNVVGV